MKSNEIRDITGTVIEVGDKVVFNPPYLKGLSVGEVTGTTPCGVNILYTDSRYDVQLFTNRKGSWVAVVPKGGKTDDN